MNTVDIVILIIVGLSVLFGLYRGFVSSVFSTGGSLIAFGGSFFLYPKLAALIQSNPSLQRTLLSYTDAERRLGDLSLGLKKVADLTQGEISQIVERANLPSVFGKLLRSNLENEIFTGIDSVTDYVSETIVSACINILCFIAAFVIIYLALSLLMSLIRAIVKLPVLKQMDAVLGGLFGILRGVLFVYVLFTLVPMVETIVPLDAVTRLMAESHLANLFSSGALITAIMNGSLFG